MAPTRPKLSKRLFARAAVVCASSALTFGVVEAALRALDVVPLHRRPLRGLHVHHPSLGWVGAPDHRGRLRTDEFDVAIELGPDGFRATSRTFEVPPDAPLVAILGDSFAWGWGVEQGETVADHLQDALGARARVESFALPGYSTGQQRLELEEIVLPRSARVALVFFFGNDPRDTISDQGGIRPRYELEGGALALRNHPVREPVTGWFEALARRSIAVSMLDYARDRAADAWRGDVYAREVVTPGAAAAPSEPVESWHVCVALLGEMARLARDARPPCDLRVVYVPTTFDATGSDRNDVFRAFFARECARIGVAWLDLTPAFRAAWSEAPEREPNGWPYYYRVDNHWTALGHRLAASEVSKTL
jgi:hypothetical protein